jgi:hypothetical protein
MDREKIRLLTDRQREVIHRVNEQKETGVLIVAAGETKGSVNSKTRTLDAVLSSETVDRYGDVIMARAYDTPENFRNYFDGNPILKWAHGRDSSVPDLPIGEVKNPSFTGLDMNGNAAFEGTVKFHDTHQHAQDVWRLYEVGGLRTFSVGFRPIQVSKKAVKENQTGLTFQIVDLLENSAVPIPANPAAMRKSFQDGSVSEEFLERCFFKMRDDILVRNSDIFIPTSWRYKDSINDLAQMAIEIKAGTLLPSVKESSFQVISSPMEYDCLFCEGKMKTFEELWPMKSYSGLDLKGEKFETEFRDVKCEHCQETAMACLEGITALQSVS